MAFETMTGSEGAFVFELGSWRIDGAEYANVLVELLNVTWM
jgi:hypothetical protein